MDSPQPSVAGKSAKGTGSKREGETYMYRFIMALLVVLLAQAWPAPGAADIELQQGAGVRLTDPGDPLAKVHHALLGLHDDFAAHSLRRSARAFAPRQPFLHVQGNSVVMEAVAEGDPKALAQSLAELGMTRVAVHGRVVSGLMPISDVEQLADVPGMRFARPVMAVTNAGLATSQGSLAMKADTARSTYDTTGSGVRVGVLSDSYNAKGGAATDIANNDLPSDVQVLEDYSTGTDEGRAMMQIVHDVAPGASLAFHTAYMGESDFAQGIKDLASAGCKVIVDDVIYLSEPMFQDGVVAQAVDQVVASGVSYHSAAGNFGRASYQAAFNSSGQNVRIGSRNYGVAHNFASSGTDMYQSVTVPSGKTLTLILQWDQPFYSVSGSPGSANNVNIFIVNSGLTSVLASGNDPSVGGDPVEVASWTNTSSADQQVNVLITLVSGAAPGVIKYVSVYSGPVFNEYATNSPTLFGHANASGAVAVGAAYYRQTPVYGTSPATLESYSALGGVPILFSTSGAALATAENRGKPDIVAPDGVDTTFFGSGDYDSSGYTNFFGTSAAAPHSAAVAALMRSAFPSLTPLEIAAAIRAGGQDMDNPYVSGFDTGWDATTGYGFLDAMAAMQAAQSALPEAPAMGPLALAGALGLAVLAARWAGRSRASGRNAA